MADIQIVGSGVIGLSCAARLAEAGHRVRVYGSELPPHLVSAVAAAIWYPYLAQPRDRVTDWAAAALTEFTALSDRPGTGIVMTPGTEVFREPVDDPWWTAAVPDAHRVSQPRPGYAQGWSFTAPIIEMGVYLSWLQARVRELGVTVEQRHISSLDELDGLVVNATGLGSRDLLGDNTMQAVRGQIVYLEQVGLDRWWIDDSDLENNVTTYVVPRSRDIVVGGTEDHGAEDLTIDTWTASGILDRARALVPQLADAPVIGHNIGLRPARPTVRLERDRDVIHCYGHGGAGVTLSWGCADEVVTFIE